jgi:hypothetical protein
MWVFVSMFALPRECEREKGCEMVRYTNCESMREKTKWECERLKKQEKLKVWEKENESEKERWRSGEWKWKS